ncbi:MAG: hypothetical protein JXA64_01610 [Candidatus Fermentibacteraceae bacterium]|nr:hypothetical protein [Candidatus Fermentibacteraceae bacterium]MBN2607784.1 hypothetical protein [Candidatus Fermentibacteraceae bacterium]
MRNSRYLFFWTELGRRITGDGRELPPYLPKPMVRALEEQAPDPGRGLILTDGQLSPREARFIYGRVWDELRCRGFSRPLRLYPWPGISLLIPFFRGSEGVIPQSFSRRVPSRERALAMVGRAAAARRAGFDLLVVMATWDDDVLNVLENGRVRACSMDRLIEMVP